MSSPANKKRKNRTSTPVGGVPTSVAGFKQSDKYILESQLTCYDYIPPDVKARGLFQGSEPFYERQYVIHLRSAAQWRGKFNRSVREGEKPTRVISRDVGGVQRTIELYAEDQTEPWKNVSASREHGIPTNDYGIVEIDRIPENAVLVPCADISLAVRVCKSISGLPWCRCQSGWKRKSPVYVGVVVLLSDQERVHDAINEEYVKELRDQQKAKEVATMTLWRLLIRRMQAEWYIKAVVDG